MPTLSRTLGRVGALSVVVVLALAGLAGAQPAHVASKPKPSKHKLPTVKLGAYAPLGGVKSAPISFHVTSGGAVGDLSFSCVPVPPDASSTTIDIQVHAPALTIVKDQLSYSGPARVTSTLSHAPTLALTTLKLSAQHQTGPTYQYSSGDKVLTQSRAWTGTASTPACRSIVNRGRFTLFGPFPGR